MAAAALAGMIPVFHSVVGDKSRYYIGRQLWFGFIAVYGVVVYVVHNPWTTIKQDFYCHGNITKPCLMECFEKHFSHPVVGLWYFFYFLFLAFFFLMEFIIAQIRRKLSKSKMVAVADEVEVSSLVAVQEQISQPHKSMLDFHQEQLLLLLYLLYFILQVGSQCAFLFILLYRHLPLVNQHVSSCRSSSCLGPTLCFLRGSMEKQMSIYTLITLSTTIIFFCSVFFMYGIHHYLLKGLKKNKSRPDKV